MALVQISKKLKNGNETTLILSLNLSTYPERVHASEASSQWLDLWADARGGRFKLVS